MATKVEILVLEWSYVSNAVQLQFGVFLHLEKRGIEILQLI